jgi:hypothetical protein
VNLENFRRQLESAGLTIERTGDWRGKATFGDMGALVYFLRAVPWSAPPDFSVERHAEALLKLHYERQPLAFTMRRFFIQARK